MINYMPKLVERATYSRRRPRATDEQVAAWRGIARAYSAVTRTLDDAIRHLDLDLSEYDALVTLAEAPPEGLRPSDLTERVLLTKSGMSRLLDRLESRGLVERRACPLDRRGYYVALSPSGRHALRRAAPSLLAGLARALEDTAPNELAALARLGERVAKETADSRE